MALPASLHVAVSAVVRHSGAVALDEVDLIDLQRTKAAAAIEELHSKGVAAEVITSLAWGGWDSTRSDGDILVIEEGAASFSAIDDALGTCVGPRFDILFLDRLYPAACELILEQR